MDRFLNHFIVKGNTSGATQRAAVNTWSHCDVGTIAPMSRCTRKASGPRKCGPFAPTGYLRRRFATRTKMGEIRCENARIIEMMPGLSSIAWKTVYY